MSSLIDDIREAVQKSSPFAHDCVYLTAGEIEAMLDVVRDWQLAHADRLETTTGGHNDTQAWLRHWWRVEDANA